MDEPTSKHAVTGTRPDPVDEFDQAYRAASEVAGPEGSRPAADDDLDARLAELSDEPPAGSARRGRADDRRAPSSATPAAAGERDLAAAIDALTRIESRLDRLESADGELGSVALVRRSHQTLGRKLDSHTAEVLDALARIERRITELERAQQRTAG